jgi:hypothetical protein
MHALECIYSSVYTHTHILCYTALLRAYTYKA